MLRLLEDFNLYSWGSQACKETVSILRGLKERYEVHHGVRILDSALVAAANLSNRYLSERFFTGQSYRLG